MKRGKEVKLDINPNYKISVGTVDNKNPKSIYISLSAWGQLLKEENEIDYDRIINKIKKAATKLIKLSKVLAHKREMGESEKDLITSRCKIKVFVVI